MTISKATLQKMNETWAAMKKHLQAHQLLAVFDSVSESERDTIYDNLLITHPHGLKEAHALQEAHNQLQPLKMVFKKALIEGIQEWFEAQSTRYEIIVLSVGAGDNPVQSDSYGKGSAVLNIEGALWHGYQSVRCWDNEGRVITLAHHLESKGIVEDALRQCVTKALERGKKIILQDYCGRYGITLMKNSILLQHLEYLGENLCFIAGWESPQPLIQYKKEYFKLSEVEKESIETFIYSIPRQADQQAIDQVFTKSHPYRQYIEIYSSVPNKHQHYSMPVGSLFGVQPEAAALTLPVFSSPISFEAKPKPKSASSSILASSAPQASGSENKKIASSDLAGKEGQFSPRMPEDGEDSASKSGEHNPPLGPSRP